MKPFKSFLLLLPIVLISSRPKPSETSERGILNGNKPFASQAVLDYVGSLNTSGMGGFIGIQVSINTSIGIRYELTTNMTGAKSHIAVFYKFSNPYQTVFYNFLTHKSTIMKGSGSKDPDPDVENLGEEIVNTYRCVHLRHVGGNKEVSDYWVSTLIPSFLDLLEALREINKNLPGWAFSGTVLKWGGLVKWTENFQGENGQTGRLELNLQKANTTVILPAKTFDVPSTKK